jgi:PAS domain S-box-containing protein
VKAPAQRPPWLDDGMPPLMETASLGARDALHLVVSLGDFQTQMTRDQDPDTILGAARLLLRRLLPFRALVFMTVDEATSEFVIADCDPASSLALVQREIEGKIADGTFSWALPQRRAVMVAAERRGHTLVFHPLLTRSRVIGMFVGVLDGARPSVTDTLLSVLSVILFTSAQALENSSLYRTMKATTVSKELLEAANAELRREIADRQRAEAALRASEARYRELYDNANDVIYTHDLEARFTSLNRAAERVFGYEPGEALGRSFLEVLAPDSMKHARRMIDRTIRDGAAPGVYELQAVARDGRRIALELSARVILTDGVPTGIQGIARDLSERKRLEARLQQLQKMEAVGRLAGGVAHDFNNLMMVVMGYADLMARRLEDGEPINGELGYIRQAAESATTLTRQLLAFSRQQVLQPAVLDVNTVVGGVEPMLHRLIGEDIELVCLSGARLGRVEADPGQLEQVIMNLVVNARDAMPRGGRLTIETADVERQPPFAAAADPGHRVVMLAVRDSGQGMDAETQSHIFEPFFTTKETGKGTGLGLSTVYGIVQQHHGWIEVESAVGHGTTFRIFLPCTEKIAELDPAPDGAQRTPGGLETVLLVEDEPPVRSLVRAILGEYGYEVIEAGDGVDALALFERNAERVHLLLTDIVMPKMSGHALAARLGAMRPGLKVLYMSGYSGDVIGHYAGLESHAAYLQKPFAPEALARKVRDLLGETVSDS